MTDEHMPADWAIQKALQPANEIASNLPNLPPWTVEEVKEGASCLGYCATVLALARYIEKHEQPPVDPDVLDVRRILAAFFGTDTYKGRYYLSDASDNTPSIQRAIAEYKKIKGERG